MLNLWIRRPIGWGRCFVLLAVVLLVAGCGRQAVDAQPGNLQITLIPAPEAMRGTHLTVRLADTGGNPVTDATVRLEGNMNHPGMAPVFSDSVQDGDDGQIDGSYQVPFVFNMLGDWIITVTVERPQGTTEQHIDVSVSETTVEVKE
jgi:hypothetical protein